MTGRGFPAGNLRAGPGCCCWFPAGRGGARGGVRDAPARPPGLCCHLPAAPRTAPAAPSAGSAPWLLLHLCVCLFIGKTV